MISSHESRLRVTPCRNRIGSAFIGPCTDAASRTLPFERDKSVISDAVIGWRRLFLRFVPAFVTGDFDLLLACLSVPDECMTVGRCRAGAKIHVVRTFGR